MTEYTVQYIMPVDNPVNKVAKRVGKGKLCFEVPINYPDAHNLSLADLIEAADRSGLILLSTGVKKNKNQGKKSSNMLDHGQPS
ncbi:MAG TPA: hypothetical protein VIY48_22385 [Candidatus Paceibacterota bacterium]